MAAIYDILIVGAGPGGVAAAYAAGKKGYSHIILEKGKRVFQGIIDSYPKGKKVYPTVPRGEEKEFPVEGLTPPAEKVPVEQYVEQAEAFLDSYKLNIQYEDGYHDIVKKDDAFTVETRKNSYRAKKVIFAFGSNIPNDLGVYGEAKTVARRIDNVSDYIGRTTLVIGGGNAAADIVAALSKEKREAGDTTHVYWGHTKKQFKVNKNTARDLGEEILLGGQIKILQGAIPKIGEVDTEGIDRLYIHQSPEIQAQDDVFMYQGMSFPMKNVIACVGTHGPAGVFNAMNLQQIACTGNICKIAREGEQLLLLTTGLETSREGIYAIGGSISPSYMEVQGDGTIREKKHSNLIYTAIKDAVTVINSINL